MGRNRGKFSFPLPGRRTQKQAEQDDEASSIPSTPSMPEWPSRARLDEPSSKAHRLLGTSDTLHRSTTKMPASPGYMSITVSEASFGSEIGDKASGTAADYSGLHVRPDISRRPSSNVMGRAYSNNGREGSDHSTASHRLEPQTSNSTLRSHYDPKSSPLSISQQTSDSAVRDMALRRGKPQVVSNLNNYTASPISPLIVDETRRKDSRKSKPARLDLSKLFPKPKAGAGPEVTNTLLSPTKIVSSPAAMSMSSEYFPRPMTREPTPNPRVQAKLKKTSRRHADVPLTPSSPVRQFQRDEYDNAKIHIRRPPKGVQHWFDALEDDSDEALEHAAVPIFAPKAVHPVTTPLPDATPPQQATRTQQLKPMVTRHDTFTHEDLVDVKRLNSPSQFSLVSTKTKESALSRSNLQNSSILSFSSSEDEDDDSRTMARKVAVRKSLDIDESSDIVIGQAQAFEVRPHRRPSAGGVSTLSTSTSAATIQVMYTPEPSFSPFHYPRSSHYSGSRRSSHNRQPSVILEDDDVRPNTAINMPLSPSAYSAVSARTSASEPKPRTNGEHKMMEVTAEEEALLELMRKKRASMAKKNTVPRDFHAREPDTRQKIPSQNPRSPYRTSGFLAEASPVRVVETTRKAPATTPSPLLLSPRGRQRKTDHEANEHSQLRDSSTSDAWSEHRDEDTLPHHIPTPSEASPIDLFSPTSLITTASYASPMPSDQPSPPLSPITPGLRAFESEINVKVASSDTSNDSDEALAHEMGAMDTTTDSTKSSKLPDDISAHRRRRTASSGANLTFSIPLTVSTPVLPISPQSTAATEPPVPRINQKSDKRMSTFIFSTDGNSRSRQSSTHSNSSQQSLQSRSSSSVEKKTLHRMSTRPLGVAGVSGDAYGQRDSVSNDVLAAWGSLGGTY